jgi:beta-mannosidase
MTTGPWQPILLKQYTSALSTVHTKAAVSADLHPSLAVDVTLSGDLDRPATLKVLLKDAKGHIVREGERKFEPTISASAAGDTMGKVSQGIKNLAPGLIGGNSKDDGPEFKDVVKWEFTHDEVQLWWPVCYGDQTLYDVEVRLEGDVRPLSVVQIHCSLTSYLPHIRLQDTQVLDRASKRVGFRRVELVQEVLSKSDRYGKGTSFLFEVNGVRVFIGGSSKCCLSLFLLFTARRSTNA